MGATPTRSAQRNTLSKFFPDFIPTRPSSISKSNIEISRFDSPKYNMSMIHMVLGGEPESVLIEIENVNNTIARYLTVLGNIPQQKRIVAAIDFTALAGLPKQMGQSDLRGLMNIEFHGQLKAQFLALHQPIKSHLVEIALGMAERAMAVQVSAGPTAASDMFDKVDRYLWNWLKQNEKPRVNN